MSFRVLIIPEDPTYNGYILKLLVGRMLVEIDKPNAFINVLTNPKLNGYDHAVRAIRGELIERYRHFDLWLFLPDADRAGNFDRMEEELSMQGITLCCCAAQPEVEVWLLAGFRKFLPLSWADIRNHRRLKEDIFEPFLHQYGDVRQVGAGRARLMSETLSNYRGLLTVCPELNELQEKLRGLPLLRE